MYGTTRSQVGGNLSDGTESAIRPRERDILRRLATEVARLAALPCQQSKRSLWIDHNSLKRARPVIVCDPENGWHEIIPQDELKCSGALARAWEFALRMEIFWGDRICDDYVIEPHFNCSHVYTESDWGIGNHVQVGGNNGGSFRWDPPLKDFGAMERMRFPAISIDHIATEQVLDLANSVFGDILTVRLKTSWWWSLGLTMTLAFLRGLEAMMLDMIEHPEDMHRLMAFIRDGHLAKLDFLEANGLLAPNHDGTYVGSGGFGWTDELPAPGFRGAVRTRDMWGFCESQETVSVSPSMFEEFVFQYQLPVLERFGLNCYGCCEPLDRRWDIVKKTPRLRRVSVSPWSNLRDMSEKLASDYVLSYKPHPSVLAFPSFNDAEIRAGLRSIFEITRNNRVEVIMKDCHTIGNDPERVVRWVRIAREEAERDCAC